MTKITFDASSGFLHRIFKSGISRGVVRHRERPIYARYCPLQSGHPCCQRFDPTIQHQDPASVSWGIVVSNKRTKHNHKIKFKSVRKRNPKPFSQNEQVAGSDVILQVHLQQDAGYDAVFKERSQCPLVGMLEDSERLPKILDDSECAS